MAANVWVALATPNSPADGIPFIDETALTPNVDVVNFKWMQQLLFAYMSGGFKTDYTIAPGTGNVQIDKASGVVKFAAAAQSLVLTNAKIKDASTMILVSILTDDATAKSVIAVPIAGSATIKLNAAATGAVSVAFLVLRNSEVT